MEHLRTSEISNTTLITQFRIINHDFVGHAFTVQLSRELARRGHAVFHMHLKNFQAPHGPLKLRTEDPETLRFGPVVLDRQYPKYNFLARYLVDRQYVALFKEIAGPFQPQVILSSNASPFVQAGLQSYCKQQRFAFVNWVQDCYGKAAEDILQKKWGFAGKAAGKFISSREKKLVRTSDATVFISSDFHTVFPGNPQAEILENWAPIAELPNGSKVNRWSSAHGLHDKKVFLYSGTLGFKHNPLLLANLAERMSQRNNVAVVVVSEGIGRNFLEKQKQERNLGNLHLFDFQPFEVFPDVIATGDVLVSIIEHEAAAFSVPSKVLSYLCAQRPLLLAVPAGNLAARIVREHSAGLVVDPLDEKGFLASAEILINDSVLAQQCAVNARAYAESTFNIETIANRFESLFEKALANVGHTTSVARPAHP